MDSAAQRPTARPAFGGIDAVVVDDFAVVDVAPAAIAGTGAKTIRTRLFNPESPGGNLQGRGLDGAGAFNLMEMGTRWEPGRM